MIKTSQLDVGVLVDFIKSHGVQPDWLLMQLPGGEYLTPKTATFGTQRDAGISNLLSQGET